jgi:ElaB/YqjD/DUF883 family membrane-anchored ribosome-binding protein
MIGVSTNILVREGANIMEAKTNINIRLTEEQKQMIGKLARKYRKTTTELILLTMEYVRDHNPTFEVKPKKETRNG